MNRPRRRVTIITQNMPNVHGVARTPLINLGAFDRCHPSHCAHSRKNSASNVNVSRYFRKRTTWFDTVPAADAPLATARGREVGVRKCPPSEAMTWRLVLLTQYYETTKNAALAKR